MALSAEYGPAVALRRISAPGWTIGKGDRILAASWGGVVYVLWHGADLPVEPGTVRAVTSNNNGAIADNYTSARDEEYNEVKL